MVEFLKLKYAHVISAVNGTSLAHAVHEIIWRIRARD